MRMRRYSGSKLTKNNKIAHWKGCKVVPDTVRSNQFFAVESPVLYASLNQVNSFAGVSDDAARLYLLWLYRTSLKTNHAYPGPKDARKTLGLKKDEYYAAVDELRDKGFLAKAQCSKAEIHGNYCHDVQAVPFYDHATKTFVPNPSSRTTVYQREKGSFIMIPNALVEDGWLHKDMLSLTAIKVLLKLYEHNHLGQFGGVNPAKLYRDNQSGTYSVCPLLHGDIGIGKSQFIKTMNGLSKKGLVQEVLVTVNEYQLMQQKVYLYQCDYQFQGNYVLGANGVEMVIVRPTYQFKSHVDEWLSSLGLRGCDVGAAKTCIYYN